MAVPLAATRANRGFPQQNRKNTNACKREPSVVGQAERPTSVKLP
jgi:hypothetical protein